MNNDHIYWTFSSAAQSISAFVAFLLTGYALVYTLMEAAREKDDTLEEIHSALRKTYHFRLTVLAWVTGAAILLSLVTVFENRRNFPYKIWLIGLTSAIDLVAVIGGLWFVVSIVNPGKYEKTAERVLKEKKSELKLSGEAASAGEFFKEFRYLERLIREYLREKDLYIPSRGVPGMSFPFQQMIEALLQNEKIDSAFFEELMEISRYRNLVFHGHVDTADRGMIDRVSAAAAKIQKLCEVQLSARRKLKVWCQSPLGQGSIPDYLWVSSTYGAVAVTEQETNFMLKMGWVIKQEDGSVTITEQGREAVSA